MTSQHCVDPCWFALWTLASSKLSCNSLHVAFCQIALMHRGTVCLNRHCTPGISPKRQGLNTQRAIKPGCGRRAHLLTAQEHDARGGVAVQQRVRALAAVAQHIPAPRAYPVKTNNLQPHQLTAHTVSRASAKRLIWLPTDMGLHGACVRPAAAMQMFKGLHAWLLNTATHWCCSATTTQGIAEEHQGTSLSLALQLHCRQ